jgi:hypothetical protein
VSYTPVAQLQAAIEGTINIAMPIIMIMIIIIIGKTAFNL